MLIEKLVKTVNGVKKNHSEFCVDISYLFFFVTSTENKKI